MMKHLRKFVSFFSILALLAGQIVPAGAFLPRGVATSPPPPGFNGKKTQTNLQQVQGGGDYPWLNALKGAQSWGFANFASSAVTPDILDADGYLISATGNAASGVVTVFNVPSPQQKPGAWIYKWDGDGLAGQIAVNSGSANVTPAAYTINSITQSGGVQTVNLTTNPVEMRALQPILINSNLSGGSWAGFTGNWRAQDVGIGCAVSTNCFRINSGNTYTGSPVFGGTTQVQFTPQTDVQNVVGGLNGSGRYAVIPNPTIGGANGIELGCGIRSIQSSVNYPHNIKVVHINDEAALDAGQEFTPLFLAKAANFGVLRYLNWQDGNITNVSTWNTRKQRSYVFYGGSSFVPNFYAGATTLSGSTYTVGAPAINSATGAAWSGSLSDKTTIHVKLAQSSRPASTFTGSVAFNGGIGQWEVTVNSGLTGFIALGQTLTITGQTVNADFTIASGSGSVWQLNGGPSGGAVSSVSMATRQNFNSPLITMTAGNPNISVPNNVYQIGDQLSLGDFSGNGTSVLPTGFAFNTRYYVVAATNGPSGTIQLSTTSGGSAITPTVVNSSGLIASSIYLFINVPGTSSGPIEILGEYCNTLSGGQTTINGGSNTYPVADSYREVGTLVYDATLGKFIKYGGDIGIGSAGIFNSVPIESILSLAWSVGAHPWLISPPLAVDPVSDWWPNVMLYDKTNRPSWAKLRIEPPNELWNRGVNFFQTGFADAKSAAYHISDPTNWPLPADYHNWYGKVLSVLGQTAYQIYGPGSLDSTYQVLGGVQTPIFIAGDVNNAFPRFAATNYVNAGAVQSPLTGAWGTLTFQAVPARAYSSFPSATNYASHISTSTYFSSNAYNTWGTGGPQTQISLAATFGAVQFQASSISGGTMTIAPFTASGLSSGMTVFVPDGTTFTVGSGSDGSGWSVDPSLNIPYQQSYIAALTAGLAAPAALTDSVIDTVVNATITGNNFVVNSIVSGNTVGSGLQIYGGTSPAIPFASGYEITGGTYPNFTLSGSPGNQTANFNVGKTFSLTGTFRIYQLWGTWANTNFGITKIAAYEGGYSDDYFATCFQCTLLTARSKQASSLQTYTTQMFDNFKGLGAFPYPGGMIGEFPSNYLLTGPYPTGSAWSVLDDAYQNPPPPQWNAIINYNFLLKRDIDPASNDNDPMFLEKAA